MHAEEVLNVSQIPTTSHDRPDVSAGLMWAADRRRRELPDTTVKAPLFLPSQGFDVSVGVYDGDEWKAFSNWFRTHYIPADFVAYVLRKAEWREVPKCDRLTAVNAVSQAIVGRPACLPEAKRKLLPARSNQGVLF